MSSVLTSYPLLMDTGDDEITVKCNCELLIKEVQNDKPRKEVVCVLARQTYYTRPQKIILTSDDMSIYYILQEHPLLKKTYIVGCVWGFLTLNTPRTHLCVRATVAGNAVDTLMCRALFTNKTTYLYVQGRTKRASLPRL